MTKDSNTIALKLVTTLHNDAIHNSVASQSSPHSSSHIPVTSDSITSNNERCDESPLPSRLTGKDIIPIDPTKSTRETVATNTDENTILRSSHEAMKFPASNCKGVLPPSISDLKCTASIRQTIFKKK